MHLYAITDRRLFTSREALLTRAAQWSRSGVDYVQIREKDLDAAEMMDLAMELVQTVKAAGSRTRVLLNGPVELAVAAGCDGVHLPSNLPAAAIALARRTVSMVSVSCHDLGEIQTARDQGATLALFAPVFEKKLGAEIVAGQGLDALAAACQAGAPMPVFALGGVTTENAQDCVRAGAAGVAAIRLFVLGDWRGLKAV
ncbi:thiamine phosphate synthase [Acidobacterium sp. S8]|uniref:thiamine phosphate synthase n=1 Tax=Acidobacterium sp. S8 TaxID=1641854 RepID=UPI00131C36AC|nr:thiamine phosphate synthase [Acidobacterium sp. S8]